MATGTLDEALAWVEYCNGSGDSHWARRRRVSGHAEPFGVRYWGLGREMYRRRTAAEYVAEARRWATALKRLDPGIRLISCGQTGMDDWDRDVIDGLAAHIDMHGVHLYTGSADYWSNVLAPHYAERALSVAGALIDRARYVQRVEHEISVACDEWNVWYRTDDGQLEESYTLADALAVATWLNVFVRQSWTVRMANLARLVNVVAPIVTSPDGHVQPEHLPPVPADGVGQRAGRGGHLHRLGGPGAPGPGRRAMALPGGATSACSSGSTWPPPPTPRGAG